MTPSCRMLAVDRTSIHARRRGAIRWAAARQTLLGFWRGIDAGSGTAPAPPAWSVAPAHYRPDRSLSARPAPRPTASRGAGRPGTTPPGGPLAGGRATPLACARVYPPRPPAGGGAELPF